MKFAFALILASTVAVVAQAASMHKYASDFALQNRGCLTNQIGLDFFKANVNKVFNEYIERFNSNRTLTDVGRVFGTSDNSPYNGLHYSISRPNNDIRMTVTDDKVNFAVAYNARTESDGGKATIGGDFQIDLHVDQPKENAEGKAVPQLRLALDSAYGMAPLVFTFENGHYFDQPSATRMLLGFVRTVNEYIKDDSRSAYIAINKEASNLNVLFNCNETDVAHVNSHPVASDSIDFGISNNVQNFIWPHSYEIRFIRIITLINSYMNLWPIINEYGLRLARGKFTMVSEDEYFNQMKPANLAKLSRSGIEVNTAEDGNKTIKLDTTLFVKFEDYTNRTVHDFVIIPVAMTMDTKIPIIEQEDGRQEVHVNNEIVKESIANIKVFNCDFATNPKVDEYLKNKPASESEDDFDEDEEEKDTSVARKMKLSNFQQLLCGFTPKIADAIERNNNQIQGAIQHYVGHLLQMFREMGRKVLDEQNNFACAGVGIGYPRTRLEKNSIHVSIKLNTTQSTAPEGFCDEEDQELFKVDPRTITDEKHQLRLSEGTEFENYWHMQFWLINYMKGMWFDSKNYPSLPQVMAGFTQHVTSFYYLRDYCEKAYPDFSAHKCALTHIGFKPIREFNNMLTKSQRIYMPKDHMEQKGMIAEYKYIDDVFEVDGVLYDNEDHYTDEQTEAAKAKGEFKADDAKKFIDEKLTEKDEL